MSTKMAIIVLSCDKYADIWDAFFDCFFKNLEVPKDVLVYLGSNTLTCQDSRVETILSGEDHDWSSSYKSILSQIPESKLFVILEDLFLASKVEADKFDSIIKFMIEKDAKHIRYWANPAPDQSTGNSLIGESEKGAPYRTTVCGFWDKDCLINLLLDGESPWDFEIMGSYRSSYMNGFYSTHSPLCEYKNVIEKGSWIPASLNWAIAQKLDLDVTSRPLLKSRKHIASSLKMLIFDLVLKIPWKVRVKIMNVFRKIFISY